MNAALVQSFEQTGIEVTPYFWQKSAIQLGYRMEVDGMELVFRVEEGEIIIVLLKRVSPNLGLSNPFLAYFFWLSTPSLFFLLIGLSAVTLMCCVVAT